jgi:hypothetical protein
MIWVLVAILTYFWLLGTWTAYILAPWEQRMFVHLIFRFFTWWFTLPSQLKNHYLCDQGQNEGIRRDWPGGD